MNSSWSGFNGSSTMWLFENMEVSTEMLLTSLCRKSPNL
jgi:hypothetical protein